MKNALIGLFAATVLSAGLFAADTPSYAADLSLTPAHRQHVRHVVVRPRCAQWVGEFAERGWSDRCFWWAYHWQNYRHYRTYSARYPYRTSYR